MEWTGQFTWDGVTGTVHVECRPNDDLPVLQSEYPAPFWTFAEPAAFS